MFFVSTSLKKLKSNVLHSDTILLHFQKEQKDPNLMVTSFIKGELSPVNQHN